jgi:hypothetical protein
VNRRILGFYRETQYSPGRHQTNDVLLLEGVADLLRKEGIPIDLTTFESGNTEPPAASLVVSMLQGREALEHLLTWSRSGVRIINRPQAALNTHRDRLPELMVAAGIPFPQTYLVRTEEDVDLVARDLPPKIWLKRGDVHASVATDVQWIVSRERLKVGLAEFVRRGIELAVLQAHRAGDEIKFYGVGPEGFFHWFYSGATRKNPFDLAELRSLAAHAAAAAGLDIFGGDVIVSPTGELTLIDLNDWPSFAPCREPASRAIADLLIRRLDAD